MAPFAKQVPSKALCYLRTPGDAPFCGGVKNRRFLSSQQRLALPDTSFRGQVYESVAIRLAREREERKKYIEERDARPEKNYLGATARTTSIPKIISLLIHLSIVLISVALTGYWLGTTRAEKPSTSSTVPLVATKPPKHNTGDANLEAAWADFVDIVGKENVSTRKEDRLNHLGSSWSAYLGEDLAQPFLIVYPSSTQEVSDIMRVCHKRLIPVTAYSGGTSIEGQYATTRGGICIDFSKMKNILALHKEDLDVVVQPGVGWEYLNEELANDGLFFPPDPGPGAMIGGMVGTGCSGTNAYRYGTMRDWVLSLTVVLADGTIIKTRQRPRKSSAGYDLTRTFIGSEGTLGLVTEATLKVTTKPEATSVAVFAFSNIRQAAQFASEIVRLAIPIAAIEILDDVAMKCVNASGMTTRRWTEAPTLFFRFSGTPMSVKEQIGIVRSLSKSAGSISLEIAKNQDEQDELWSARKQALWSTMAMRKHENDLVWAGDVAVPISKLSDIIEETQKDIKKSGLFASIVGHVGDANFHAILLYNEAQRAKAEEVIDRMVRRAIKMEGTVTGEHGIGLIKRDYLNQELGESTVDAMRKVRHLREGIESPLIFPA